MYPLLSWTPSLAYAAVLAGGPAVGVVSVVGVVFVAIENSCESVTPYCTVEEVGCP